MSLVPSPIVICGNGRHCHRQRRPVHLARPTAQTIAPAAASLAWVRSAINSRSNSANAAKIPRQKRLSAWCKMAMVFTTGFLAVFGLHEAASVNRDKTARFPCAELSPNRGCQTRGTGSLLQPCTVLGDDMVRHAPNASGWATSDGSRGAARSLGLPNSVIGL